MKVLSHDLGFHFTKTYCAIALDARIEEFGEIVRESYGIEELGDPAATTDVRPTSIPNRPR